MSVFLRLLSESDKAQALTTACNHLRQGKVDLRSFEVGAESFDAVPGKPFAYWVSDATRNVFHQIPAFDGPDRTTKQGLATADDFRFVRIWWEVSGAGWFGFAKGGAFSPFYADIYLSVNWSKEGVELSTFAGSVIRNPNYYFRSGLTWPLRSQLGFGMRTMPAGCIFGHKGPSAFIENDDPDELLALLALTNSRAFSLLVSLQMAFGSYEVGVIQKTPLPSLTAGQQQKLARLARRAWSLKRTADSITETSHAFVLPDALRARAGNYDLPAIEMELGLIKAEIDTIAFDLYGFAEADREVVNGLVEDSDITDADEEDEEVDADVPSTDALLSWAVGVAFGRFDWRLATGERAAPPEPNPFDPLPTTSPGMLPDGTEPFHSHTGILVDDQGHQHDLVHLVEEVLGRVNMPVPDDVRRWLQRDFFAFHLQCYSKSRRKAPIYWPLSTASGSYTLWVYYPSLNSQTLYTSINDFIEPKLKQVGDDVAALRNKGTARSRDDEKQFELLQAFELEMIELRDTLLNIAQNYDPNHDDGVQITAAPLWPLFSHKPWQKVLKETWAKLEKGDYDWAHLAMNYWPDRVREKCKTDKSLAIAHGLEELYIEPKVKSKKTHGRAKK